jgi:hypothetical protein
MCNLLTIGIQRIHRGKSGCHTSPVRNNVDVLVIRHNRRNKRWKFGWIQVLGTHEHRIETLGEEKTRVGSGCFAIRVEIYDGKGAWSIPATAEPH